MVTKITPVNTYVLVKRLEGDNKYGQIYLSVNADLGLKVHQGEVIAVNKDCKELAIGDKIIYNKYAEHLSGSDDSSVVLVRTEDIEAVIE